MFDCGEGTQRQMQRSLGLVQVDEIYLTHFHADHILGLPGLLKTYDLTDRERAADDLRPARPARPLQDARPARRPHSATSLDLVEIEPGDRSPRRRRGPAFAVEHSVRAYGYALVEDERPGRFDPDAAEAARGRRRPRLRRPAARRGVDGHRRRRRARPT